MTWADGDVGWIVVRTQGGPVPQRVRVGDPFGEAAAGGGFQCRPCDAAGALIPCRPVWRRWPGEIVATRGDALARCG